MSNKDKVKHLPLLNVIFLLNMTFISETIIAEESQHIEKNEFINLNTQAKFIHDMTLSSHKMTSDAVISNVHYSDEELAQALSAVAVSVNGEQFHSQLSTQSMTRFRNKIEQDKNSGTHTLENDLTNNENKITLLSNIGDDSIIPMVVIGGNDDRKQVTNTAVSSPFWHTGKLDIGCTGALIGDNHVLTAGHCIADGNGNWYSNLSFTVAQNGNYKPWKKCSWKAAITTEAWFYDANSNFDYGLIVLDCLNEVGAHGGWLGFGPFVGGEHRVTGYASEKPYATMWTDFGPVTSTRYRLCYQIDTSNGESGSPITDDNHYIRGVHTTGSSSQNCGTRITSEVYSTLYHWMENYP